MFYEPFLYCLTTQKNLLFYFFSLGHCKYWQRLISLFLNDSLPTKKSLFITHIIH